MIDESVAHIQGQVDMLNFDLGELSDEIQKDYHEVFNDNPWLVHSMIVLYNKLKQGVVPRAPEANPTMPTLVGYAVEPIDSLEKTLSEGTKDIAYFMHDFIHVLLGAQMNEQGMIQGTYLAGRVVQSGEDRGKIPLAIQPNSRMEIGAIRPDRFTVGENYGKEIPVMEIYAPKEIYHN